MNERILEFAIEARKYAESKPDIYKVAYDRKFAELIIRECGKSCTLQADEDDMFRKFGIKHHGNEE